MRRSDHESLPPGISLKAGCITVLVLMARHRSGLPFYEEISEEVLRQADELCSSREGCTGGYQGKVWTGYFSFAQDAIEIAILLVSGAARRQKMDELVGVAVGIASGEWKGANDVDAGPPVIRATEAARQAEAEQVLVTAVTRELLRMSSPGLEFYELPRDEHTIAASGRVYELLHPDLRQAFRASRSVDQRFDNLPARTTSFVGRINDIEELDEKLDRYALVSVLGTAGIGKSSLAVRVAQERVEQYDDGVYYIDLRDHASSEDIFDVLAAELQVRVVPPWTAKEALAYKLGSREMLLLLDNVEHFADQLREKLGALLRGWSSLQIVLTSRVPIRLREEGRHVVHALDMAADLADAPECEAVRLFSDRAAQVNPEFRIHSENIQSVLEICRRLEGNPLAIEVAASQASSWSPSEVLESWDEFQLGEPLERTLSWTVGLLKPDEQALFRRLSVIEGDVTIEAAKAVAPEGLSTVRVRAMLARLHEVHLLGEGESIFEGEPVFRLRGVARSVAAKLCEDVTDLPDALSRHTAWIVSLSSGCLANLTGAEQDVWFQRYSRLVPDINAAIGREIKASHSETVDPIIDNFKSMFTRRPDLANTDLLIRYGEAVRGDLSSAQMGVLLLCGTLSDSRRDYDQARRFLLRLYLHARRSGSFEFASRALINLGRLEHRLGSSAKAKRYAKRAIKPLQRSAASSVRPATLLGLAASMQLDGELDSAERIYEQVRKTIRRCKDRYLEVYLLSGEANVAMAREDYARAASLAKQAARLAWLNGMTNELCSILVGCAEIEAKTGSLENSLRLLSSVRGTCARREAILEAKDYLCVERLYSDCSAQLEDGGRSISENWTIITAKEAYSTLYG